MSRPIGFSTGALAYADFRRGLDLTRDAGCAVVELSALRQAELVPMLDALDSLDLSGFRYISIHAPSKMDASFETEAARLLMRLLPRRWPIVVHPDALTDFTLWREFGDLLCVENMDKRKPIGRSAAELKPIFDQLPDASLCFDIGHARQIDTTMTESYIILREFGSRLRQVHVSEVATASKHDRLSFVSIWGFAEVANMIPEDVPLILETPVTTLDQMRDEMEKTHRALPIPELTKVA